MLDIQEYLCICYSGISDRSQEEAQTLGKLQEAKDASFPALQDLLDGQRCPACANEVSFFAELLSMASLSGLEITLNGCSPNRALSSSSSP